MSPSGSLAKTLMSRAPSPCPRVAFSSPLRAGVGGVRARLTILRQWVSGPSRSERSRRCHQIILDKGIVIDAYVRVSVVGIEILTIDARIVVASVDSYLRFAEATNRLDLEKHSTGLTGLPEEILEKGAEGKVRGAIEGVKEDITGQK